MGCPQTGSPNGHAVFRELARGIIMHYTAEPTLRGTCRWLCTPTQSSSAHFVVAKEREPWHDKYAADLPLVRRLPATIVQLRDIGSEAAHATWTNPWSYGIEMCHSGEVRTDAAQRLVWWPEEWRTPYELEGRRLFYAVNRTFEAYTPAQVATVAHLCGALRCALGNRIQSHYILGHEQVQGEQTAGAGGHDKRDPSAAFPLAAVRRAACQWAGAGDVDVRPWLQMLSAYRLEDTICRAINGISLMLGCKAEAPAVWSALARNTDMLQSTSLLQHSALRLLGYETIAESGMRLDESLRVFQRMMGLSVDGEVGPRTAQAIAQRGHDRFVSAPTSAPLACT